MKKLFPLLVLLTVIPPARAQNGNRPTSNPGNGPTTPQASTIPSDADLDRFGLTKPSEATPLLAQYEAQEKLLLDQRQAAYLAMRDKSEEEQVKIWQEMIAAQKALLAEHRALGNRLSFALKDQREKAVAAQKNAKAVESP
jgi:hypothetical protein